MFLRCFSSLGSCSHHVLSMPLRAPFLGFVGLLGPFSGLSVRRGLLWSVDVDGLMLVLACVNIGICLDGRVGHGER
jgi:hypothetical protein